MDRQSITTLLWFQAFFGSGGTNIERCFRVDSYLRTGTLVEIGTDASPCGMGGWLSMNGNITHFLACPLTADDACIYDTVLGIADSHQLWECLAVLVAVDI